MLPLSAATLLRSAFPCCFLVMKARFKVSVRSARSTVISNPTFPEGKYLLITPESQSTAGDDYDRNPCRHLELFGVAGLRLGRENHYRAPESHLTSPVCRYKSSEPNQTVRCALLCCAAYQKGDVVKSRGEGQPTAGMHNMRRLYTYSDLVLHTYPSAQSLQNLLR